VASTGTTTFVLVVALLLIAVAMAVVARWLVRSTRRDAPALAPLETMGDRSWWRSAGDARDALLSSSRPEGAHAPAPVLDFEPAAEPESEPEPEPGAAAEPDTEPEPSPPAEPAGDEIEVEVLHRYAPCDG